MKPQWVDRFDDVGVLNYEQGDRRGQINQIKQRVNMKQYEEVFAEDREDRGGL